MYSYVVEKIQENLSRMEPDAAAFAAMIGDCSPLSEAVCAVSGIGRERFRALADGERLTVSEFLALHSVADFLMKEIEKDGYGLFSHFQQGSDVAQALQERFGTSVGLEEWLPQAFARVVRAYAFCDNLWKTAGKSGLDAFLLDYHFFVDASALCSENMPDFLAQLLPVAKRLQNARRITIPYAVVASMEEMSDTPELDAFSGARDGLARIKEIQDAGLLSVRGDRGDTTVIATFLSAFSRFKPAYHMVLLTQDEVLAKAVSLLNHSGLEGDDILIASIGEGGVPSLWFQNADSAELTENQTPLSAGAHTKTDVENASPDTDFLLDEDSMSGADTSSDFETSDMGASDTDFGWLWGTSDAEADSSGNREDTAQNAPLSATSEDEFHAVDSWGELE